MPSDGSPSKKARPTQGTPDPHARAFTRAPSGVRLLLLEPGDSPHHAHIEHAASEAGLSIGNLDRLEDLPPDAALVGVGPSISDPLRVARYLRSIGSQALLVFFPASSATHAAVKAELIRDPFLYPRTELIELPVNSRKLASRMGKVVARVERQFHGPTASRRSRRRSLSATPHPPTAIATQQYLMNFLEHARDAIFSTDDAGRIVTWNHAAQSVFGFPPEAVIGQPVDVLAVSHAPGEASSQPATLIRRVLASGEPEQAQVNSMTACGAPVRVVLSVAPIRNAQGVIQGVSIITRDDSEYQRLDEALREAKRQKDEFLAIMSHELRTPLTSILGYSDMLMRGLSGPLAPATQKYISNVRSAGDRLLELVNGLVDYTRLESGVERLDARSLELPRVVEHVVLNFRGQAESKEIDLLVAISKGIRRVEADEGKLIHILRSFVRNALKFTPGGGSIAVRVEPDPETADRVRVLVVDSGIGMRPEQIERVWDHFYQGDASLTRPYGGMGLGLSIARHLVALHGGTVGAASPGPDRGSTFWFTLPVRRGA